MRSGFTFLLVLLFFSSGAQPAKTDRINKIKATLPVIEKLYQDYAEKNHFPGLAFGLVVDGQLLLSGASGFSEIATSTKATPQSLFRIASMSKSVTAMAVLALRKEGKLKLDDPASLYIPELESMPPLTKDAPDITIRHLLTHAAGFPEDNPWGDRQLDSKDEELIALIKKGISFSNVPGITYEYSNLGFAMLGKIISNVSGKPYQQYIDEAIFKPLGMNNTIWEYSKAPSKLLAHGYRYEDDIWKEEELLHDGTYGAMGGLITSIEDFSKYVTFHLSAWPPSSVPETGPVARSDVREMQMPWNFNNLNAGYKYPGGRPCAMVSAYGYGLRWSKDCEGRTGIGHTGGLPGFGSQWQILPEYGIGIIAHANRTYAGMATINTAVLDTIIAMAGLTPLPVKVSNVLDQRKNALLKLLPDWKNAEQSGIFAENFFPDKSVAHRKKELDLLLAQTGTITGVSEIIAENQLRGTFRMNGNKGSIKVYFTLSPENPALIQQLDFSEAK
ncbi:serine hydrolase domain-containing protein [Dyadobacter sediminis]|uniref:Beta-lactamase family protein n=1 Tax=Dyadobacter sediminis TaxID=1493691 RepID=A0A5R9KJC7_9BACT|nr:serine hydrolase domain-containing protein [Dyadobacter sediminis]TLU96315.1 beta-lactamase family protein [Dyadobacter sediminis]GGB81203.1 penicillin-binding protein [Dyadobacter sediminis]